MNLAWNCEINSMILGVEPLIVDELDIVNDTHWLNLCVIETFYISPCKSSIIELNDSLSDTLNW